MFLMNLMLILFFILFCITCIYIDNSKRKIISLSTMPLFFFMALSFPSLEGAPKYLFLYGSLSGFPNEYVYTYIILMLCVMVALILSNKIIAGNNIEVIKENDLNRYDVKYIVNIFYCCSLLSTLAFLSNLSNVIDILTSNMVYIRDYESEFGSNSVINYLYFLHVITIPCYFYLTYIKKVKVKFGFVLFSISVIMPFFHGIKFTVFDALFPTVIFYYLLSKEVKIKNFLYIFIFGLCFLYLFFTYARGAGDGVTWYQAIINYIMPNYYNLAFTIEKFGYQNLFDGGYSLLFPTKLPKPDYVQNIIINTEGFLLNYKYNMYTSILAFYRILGVFSGFGYMVFIILISVVYRFACKKNNFIWYFIFAILITCNFLSFYYWMLFKLKYIWLILFVFFLYKLFNLRVSRG